MKQVVVYVCLKQETLSVIFINVLFKEILSHFHFFF